MRKLAKFFFPGILLIGFLITLKSFDYYQPDFSSGYLLDKKEAFAGIFKWGLYGHIATAPLLLLISSLLLFFPLEKRLPALHRCLGTIYVVFVLAVSAPSALVLSFYAFGGLSGKISFGLLSLLWWFFTCLAYKQACKKDFKSHQVNMSRSFLLVLSAVNLRLFTFIFSHFLEWSGPEMYSWASWLSWLPFLLIYELKQKGFFLKPAIVA